jgi:HlyD family secretion protein
MNRTRPAVLLALLAALASLPACDDGETDAVAVGTIERDRVELIAEASEPIVDIAVREGQDVSAGDVVLTLDQRRLNAQVERAEGARDRAMARLAELERGPRSERIEEARAAVTGLKGVLDKDRRALERARSLRREGVVSESGLDAAQAAFDNSQAQYERAVAELDALQTGTTPEELDQARAAVAETQAALDAMRLTRDRLVVRAPVDGLVDALPFELGDQPPVGAAVAVMLTGAAPYARVYVPEPIRPSVLVGDGAEVSVDGIDRTFDARVRMISSEASFTPFFALTEKDRGRLTYLAELDLEGDQARDLPTGIPAEVRFRPRATASRGNE